jgi:hypothetical protein
VVCLSEQMQGADHPHSVKGADGVQDVVNIARYPIADLERPEARKFVERCRASLGASSACILPEFVRPECIIAMAREAEAIADQAYEQHSQFSPYIGDVCPPDLPADHPRRHLEQTDQAAVAWDRIPPQSAINRLYMWDGLTDFLRSVLGKDVLFRSADPLAACNLAFIGEGGQLGWHFDSSEFSITLQVQAPESGGEFQYVPNIREVSRENYNDVAGVLRGDHSKVIRVACVPGCLSIFRGRRSIHRVTPVAGQRARITAVLTYAETAGFLVSDYSRRTFYGRLN